MSLLISGLMVAGVMVVSAPISWAILTIGEHVTAQEKPQNKSQAKRNK